MGLRATSDCQWTGDWDERSKINETTQSPAHSNIGCVLFVVGGAGAISGGGTVAGGGGGGAAGGPPARSGRRGGTLGGGPPGRRGSGGGRTPPVDGGAADGGAPDETERYSNSELLSTGTQRFSTKSACFGQDAEPHSIMHRDDKSCDKAWETE